ncbi:MAG: hypothetical protein NTY09_13820 [bacterium]|nr:hypothetical protein [bacterium]
MKDEWYGDKRDLKKWSVLLHLADKFKADMILQITYFRPSRYGSIAIDNEEIELRPEVKAHFRDIRRTEKIDSRANVKVFDNHFIDRCEYHDAVISLMQSFSNTRCIVFLDPDIGLEPKKSKPNTGVKSKKQKLEHVLEGEVRQIWLALKAEDTLVFYQHMTNRNNQPWIEPKREQLAKSMQVDLGLVKVAQAPKIIKDVAFYYCQKHSVM